MFELSGKVALVTGASRGIGRQTALTLAEQGADIVLTDLLMESERPSDEELQRIGEMAKLAVEQGLIHGEETAEKIREMGRRCRTARMDVSNRERVREVIQEVLRDWGAIDILVNNAGTTDHKALVEKQSDDLWERDLAVNLSGPMYCSQAVLPAMKEQEWGRIVNISSMAGVLGGFGQASYAATKSGILGLTRTIALEGARFGVTANAIAPGPIETDAFLKKVELGIDEEINRRIIRSTAMRRMGEPRDIAGAVAFFASEEAKFVTGQVMNVAGGQDLFVF